MAAVATIDLTKAIFDREPGLGNQTNRQPREVGLDLPAGIPYHVAKGNAMAAAADGEWLEVRLVAGMKGPICPRCSDAIC
jgi:hypothetical protein